MDDGLPWGESPIDLAEEDDAALQTGWGWIWGVLASSSVVLALFNAHAVRNWAEQLPPSAMTAPIVAAAEHWYDTADRLGLNRMVDGAERAAKALRGDRAA